MINLIKVYEESIEFFRRNWVQVTAALLLLFFIEWGLTSLFPSADWQKLTDESSGESVLNILPMLLLRIAYIIFINEVVFAFHQLTLLTFIRHWKSGEQIDFISALKESRQDFAAAVKIPGLVFTRIFLPLLVLVPGVYLSFLYTFSFHAAVIDRVPGKEALNRSRELVKAHWKSVLLLLVGNLVFTIGGDMIFGPLNRWGGEGGFNLQLGLILSALTFGAITQISMIFFYFRLREEEINPV